MSQHRDNPTSRRAVTAAVVTSLIPFAGQAATAGRVDFTVGDVTRTDKNGKERRLRKGSVVSGGDTIRTAARGRAQLRFSDGSRTALLPNTEFRVDEYRFDGQEDENSRSFFSLLKGGLRTITGAIGKLRKKSYQVQTPVATIGIRGTEYLVVLGNSSNMWVGSGGVVSTNDAGSFFCSGFCYVPDQNSPMVNVVEQPFYSAPPPTRPKSSEGTGTNEDPDNAVVDVTFGDPLADITIERQRPGLPDGEYTVGVAVYDGSVANAFVAGAGALANVKFDDNGAMEAYAVGDTSAVRGTAPAIEVGVAGPLDSAAVVGWSRWTNGTYSVTGSAYNAGCSGSCDPQTRNLSDPQSHHSFAVDPPEGEVAAQNALFTYGLAGFTTPTTASGTTAPGTDRVLSGTLTFNTRDLDVNVQDMRVIANNGQYDITLDSNTMSTNASSNYTFAGGGSVTDNNGNFDTGCGASASFAGALSTGFTHAATAYKASSSGGNNVVGVTAWQQQSQAALPPAVD